MATGSEPRESVSRRCFLQGTAAAAALAVSGCRTVVLPEQAAAARAIIEKYPTFDMHTHVGRIFTPQGDLDGTKEAMTEAGLTAFCFSPIADRALLRSTDRGIRVFRQPAPGQLYADTYRQFVRAVPHFKKHDMIEIHLPDDIRAAKAEGGHGVLIAIEGGDFLEGRLERIEEAHERGVRSIQLVHNRINALGDIQTKPPEHRGLTPFGRQVVREMNRLGLIVDVAHLSFEGMREVIEVADKPIMLSHGMLGQGGRAISDDYARAVAATGGVIGLFSAGERTLGGYLDRFRRLADLIGAEHVGFGSDMGSYGPFYVFKNYRDLPALVAGLLQRGFNEAEVAGIIGGNFLRMFDAVSAASAA